MMRVVKTLLACAALSAVACGGDSGNGTPDAAAEPTGMKTQFVSDTLTLPTTAAQSSEFGIDLDGDEQGRPDNALGGILATLAGQGVDLQVQVDEGVSRGELI